VDSLSFFREVRFEAARRLPRSRGRDAHLHGHSFRAIVDRDADSHPFDYADLNQVFEHPTDAQLLQALTTKESSGALTSQWDCGVRKTAAGEFFAFRTFRFESAHRLPHVPPGHKCGRLHGHGFRVVIHVPIRHPEASTHEDYDRIHAAWRPLHEQLNGRYLNDLPGLENPTSEWLAVWVWKALIAALPDLAWVTVYETASCGAHYDGEIHRIWKDFSFDSAVQDGGRISGHTWLLRLHLKGPLHPVFGWTLDFADMKRDFEPLFLSLDHLPLHESSVVQTPDLKGIAEFIRRHGPTVLPALGRVDVMESTGLGVSLDWDLDGLQVLP
jgi:6-pyruvoyltetrahydropterin/6-carboxytetrahydropterin synthase